MEPAELHPILRRHLRRSGIAALDDPPTAAQWHAVLARISTAYQEAAEAEGLNERALALSSAEMQDLYRHLEDKVAERTREIEIAQERLIATNVELQAQGEELEIQHDLLQQANRELEVKTLDLEEQRMLLAERNTRLEQARRAFEEKAEEAFRASQYKSAFLASMSHELRTPLNSMLLLSSILSQNDAGNLTGEQVEAAQVINNAGSDLLALINSILDLAKIESGGMELTIEPVELGPMLRALESMFLPVARDKGLGFRVSVAPDADRQLATDASKLSQILRNLLSNAFKFTEAGEVTLEVSAARDASAACGGAPESAPAADGAEARYACFCVRDTGIGFEAGQRDVIFEAFQQGDRGTARKYGGTGLGLSISREYARLLGGDILATSEPGGGSTFRLMLPLPDGAAPPNDGAAPPNDGAAPPNDGTAVPSATEPGAVTPGQRRDVSVEPAGRHPPDNQLAGATVLIVDDDPRNVFAIGNLLERHGAAVHTAEDGARGLLMLADHPETDVVLMDIMMPEMDGYEAIAAIRADPAHRDLPVVALTALAMGSDRERCLAAGASDYIAKPARPDELLTSLRRWLGR